MDEDVEAIDVNAGPGATERAARSWFGYGRWNAPYWFVGMEPGGSDGHASCEAWLRLGGTDLIDCRQHHLACGFTTLHTGERPPTQPTWRRLIQLLLAFQGKPTDLTAISLYQRDKWGTADGETAVAELSALHARNLAEESDRHRFRAERIATLTSRLRTFRPTFAVFYGLKYRAEYERIAGVSLTIGELAWSNGTLCVLTPHPIARGPQASASWWIDLGRRMRAACELPERSQRD